MPENIIADTDHSTASSTACRVADPFRPLGTEIAVANFKLKSAAQFGKLRLSALQPRVQPPVRNTPFLSSTGPASKHPDAPRRV